MYYIFIVITLYILEFVTMFMQVASFKYFMYLELQEIKIEY